MWACDQALTSTIVESYRGVGPLFTQTLQTLIAAHCALAGDHLWPADATEELFKDPNYDFIVVGSGSSGSVVANRLSEVPNWKILLVEAGGDPTLGTEAPQLFYSSIGSKSDWGYRTEPGRASKAFKDERCAWPRGKVLGGCSSINGMYYVRGNKADYDEWAAAGNYGWSYDDVLPYFKKSENFSKPLTKENEIYHSKDGYLNIQYINEVHNNEKMILDAFKELGLNTVNDINGANQIGATISYTTIRDGIRLSTARAFLNPVKDRKNLHVIKNALASKILFEPNTNNVRGVLIHKNGQDIIVNVRKELILSAGAVNTPQLLLLSGIGPSKHLTELNIEVRANLPVGENLQDHLFVPMYFTMPGNKDTHSLDNIINVLFEYLLTNKGPLSDIIPHRVMAFLNTTDMQSVIPDIQYHFVFYPPKQSNFIDVFRKHQLKNEFCNEFEEINQDKVTLMVYNTLLRPKSKGKILLKSVDPNDHPLIYSNYFDNPDDLKTIVRAMKFMLKLNETKAFYDADTGLKLNWLKLTDCKKYEVNTDHFLECVATQLTFSLYHPAGSVRMGADGDTKAVLDPELRVRKVNGLRVIDASIMPNIVRGNTNAPCIMFGEKGADMIKKYWLNKHTEL